MSSASFSAADGAPHTGVSSVALLLVAAGMGTRLGAGVPKAMVPLSGESLLTHALRGGRAALPGAQLVVVVPPGDSRLKDTVRRELGADAAQEIDWVDGGAERSDSVRAGLERVSSDLVLVHDCARALTPASVFGRVTDALRQGAVGAIPAVPVVDTIKTVTDDGAHIASTPPRSALRAVQTPQGFVTSELRRAHDLAASSESTLAGAAATDDAMLLESLGLEVRLVEGHAEALKVTTPIDLVIAEYYLRERRP